ncbi:hypothetical protein [Alkaliphilus peptidifermentans]|uniref:Uncharacterized protein n=1 Tax=Alkaliphilus peptidifermentans DSM 18978 TaxID=1120976 RepID=A0A1G5CCA4_9FIRM|nr:hypothetical protein [Alkaliphilus peptidifermentans]SCY00032.1 hypothetical protein SAMN03080606_00616 [Alkaliphilus peptidifermentans DSM 18978]
MNIPYNVKRFISFLIIVSIGILIIFGIVVWRYNWNMNYFFNEKTIPLEGELVTDDEYLTIIPKEIVLNHKGIILRAEYRLSEELKENGFYIGAFHLPRLMLEKNPKDNHMLYSYAPGQMAKSAYSKDGEEGTYLEYFYPYKDIDFKEGDSLQLNLSSADLLKEIEEVFPIELNNWVDIPIEELAEYKIRIVKQKEDSLIVETSLRGKTGNYMSIKDSVYSIVGDQEIKTGNGGGSGTGQLNYYSFKGNYQVDQSFWQGDHYVHLYYISMEIGPYYENYPRLMLIEGE